MRRIHLIVEYDGTNYAGWQRQLNALAVQQVLEEALSRLTGQRVVVHGASRTDAGVHALGQSCHFDTLSRIPADKFSYAVNTLLPPDIRVRASREVSPDFHARFSTVGKRYRYLFYDDRHAGALNRFTHAHSIYPLNDALMRAEAGTLIGTHDFAAFAASGSVVKDTVRTIWRADVTRSGHDVQLIVEGSGFLYNMVRIIAGTLRDIGSGKLAPGALRRAIDTGDRLDLGVTAPAHGLTLMEVFYDLPEAAGRMNG
ncbi:MAG: tRNA pseudouridine(38-40) synthase TruA [Clostridia bacterium]|nr:tRNA pseudouridine(38-40) synthase TruA [Clostridia bacterium]